MALRRLRELCPELAHLSDEEIRMLQESTLDYFQNQRGSNTGNGGEPGINLPEILLRGAASLWSNIIAPLIDAGIQHGIEGSNENGSGSSLLGSLFGGGSQSMGGDLDPDRMTYESLRSLGESLGMVNSGVPADIISRLPSYKYKQRGSTRQSWRQNEAEKEECAICRAEFERGDKMTALPCAHSYHTECIIPWLKEHKQCPICQKEVIQ